MIWTPTVTGPLEETFFFQGMVADPAWLEIPEVRIRKGTEGGL